MFRLPAGALMFRRAVKHQRRLRQRCLHPRRHRMAAPPNLHPTPTERYDPAPAKLLPAPTPAHASSSACPSSCLETLQRCHRPRSWTAQHRSRPLAAWAAAAGEGNGASATHPTRPFGDAAPAALAPQCHPPLPVPLPHLPRLPCPDRLAGSEQPRVSGQRRSVEPMASLAAQRALRVLLPSLQA